MRLTSLARFPIALLVLCQVALPQTKGPVWSEQEKPIAERIRTLREVPDSERPAATADLALKIRGLRGGQNKETLANQLALLSTEGDPGRKTLAEVANTLAGALREFPPSSDDPYLLLAQLSLFEHVPVTMDDARYQKALEQLKEDDRVRASATFTLTGLDGKRYSLADERGHVVLVNFWATWCPPCRKEMPDLDALQKRFGNRLRILAISDEPAEKVTPFLAQHPVSYPILLDPDRKANEAFRVEGIPKSFVLDSSGKLVAEAIDMRTERQFLEMLKSAGLK
jgi:thiol-disulfide isomerase/thioredoxin